MPTCSNIYMPILSQYLYLNLRAGIGAQAYICSNLAPLSFSTSIFGKQPKFQYSPLHVPACGWAFIIGRLKIRNLVFPVSTTLVGTSLTTAQAKLPYEVRPVSLLSSWMWELSAAKLREFYVAKRNITVIQVDMLNLFATSSSCHTRDFFVFFTSN